MDTGSRRGTLFHTDLSKCNFITYLKIHHIKSLRGCGSMFYQYLFFTKMIVYVKRVSLRLSGKKRASVSIEAAMVIPFFLFCFLEISSLLHDLSAYSGVLYALKTVGDTVSVYGYALEQQGTSDQELKIGQKVISNIIFKEAYLEDQIRGQCSGRLYEEAIQNGSQGIRLTGSYLNRERDELSIVAHYTLKPLFSAAGTSLEMTNRYYGRLWTGYDIEGIADRDYVYVTEHGTVYHVSESCSYLRLSIMAVKESEIDGLRNENGSRYQKCSLCCDEDDGTLYYVTKMGERYHKDISCSGLKRTIYRIEKEQAKAEGMDACSRCG